MPFELKPGQGTLHRVLDKEGNENRPDYHGELNIDGTIHRLAGWIKLSPRGAKWLSLHCELPREKAALETVRRPAAPAKTIDAIDPDEDIPF